MIRCPRCDAAVPFEEFKAHASRITNRLRHLSIDGMEEHIAQYHREQRKLERWNTGRGICREEFASTNKGVEVRRRDGVVES